ncbi:MAG: hypothetical protein IRZ08_14855 [Frankia sp.]|nr:hypothetical protein [Frankia sp.]
MYTTPPPGAAAAPGGARTGGRHRARPRAAEVFDGELYPVDGQVVSPPTGATRRGADEEIIDAEIVDDGYDGYDVGYGGA